MDLLNISGITGLMKRSRNNNTITTQNIKYHSSTIDKTKIEWRIFNKIDVMCRTVGQKPSLSVGLIVCKELKFVLFICFPSSLSVKSMVCKELKFTLINYFPFQFA